MRKKQELKVQIIAAIIAVAGALTAVVSVFKWFTWKLQKTPQQTKEDIDQNIQKSEDNFSNTGRP